MSHTPSRPFPLTDPTSPDSPGRRRRSRRSPAFRPRDTSGVGVAVAAVMVVLGLLVGSTADASPVTASAASAVPATSRPGSGVGTSSQALDAARAIADGHTGTGMIGPHLAAELGYQPVLEGSRAARGDGDCSSPVPLPESFEAACRVHDLGYDLLRVAHRHERRFPDGLRSDLDTLLGRQMRDSCDGRVFCTLMAGIAHAAVHLNTVRQGHGAPVAESSPW